MAGTIANMLFNPDLLLAARGPRPTAAPPRDAVEALPGWWLLRVDDAGSGESVTAGRGYVRLSGREGTRMFQLLGKDAQEVRLTARVRVRSGALLVGAAMDRDIAPTARVEPRTDADGDAWQEVDLGASGTVNQVVFYCAEQATVADIASVTLSRNGTRVKSAAAAVKPAAAAALKPDPGDGGGGGNQPDPTPTLRITSLVCPGGNGAEPGALFPVTVVVDPYLVGRVIVEVTCNGNSYVASEQPDGSYQTQVHAYVSGSISISATATGICTLGQWSSHYQQHVTSPSAQVYMPVTLVSPTPTLTVTMPASIALADGQATNLPVTVTTADTTKFGPRTVSVVLWGNATTLTQADALTFTGVVSIQAYPRNGAVPMTVFAQCAAFPAQTGERAVTVTAVDDTPPAMTVLYPHPDTPAVLTDLTRPVHVVGTAADDQSGVVSVTWSLTADDAHPTPAQTKDGWASWAADVVVPAYAVTPLYLCATDASGNAARSTINMDVRQVRAASTIDERLAPTWYLLDLLDFAVDDVNGALRTDAGATVALADIVAALRQPVDRMALPQTDLAAEQATAAVNELRVPIEVLRAHIAAEGITAHPEKPKYLQSAYNSLLGSLGTSYAQLRLARAAAQDERVGLAAQLGIALVGSSRPDQLDELVLDVGSTLTEASLEARFGLASTQRPDPLQPVLPGDLLGWQQAAARMRWQAQDLHPPMAVAYQALLDPDVVADDEILSPAMASTLTSRRQMLTDREKALTAARTAAGSPAAALAAILSAGLPAKTDVTDIGAAQDRGNDVSARLTAAGLDQAGLSYLLQIDQLVGDGAAITDAEWSDAIDVLVASLRCRSYPGWRAEEASASYVFGPETARAATPPDLGRYRAQPAARADWERTLTVRTAEYQAINDGIRGMLAGAERTSLSVLRDELLADIGGATGDDGDGLTRRYELNILSSGALTTTRLDIGIAALQLLYQDIRAGTVVAGSPARTWTTAPEFDAPWNAVMNSYGSWRAAMNTYLFPEAALDPLQFTPATPNYLALVAKVQNGGVLDADAFDTALTDWQTAVLAWLQGLPFLLGPTGFSYFDSARGAQRANRVQVAQYCHDILHVNPQRPQSDLDTAREVFWAAPMLIANALRDQGQYQTALEWYQLVYAYGDSAGQPSLYSVVDDEAAGPLATPQLGANIWAIRLDPFALTASAGQRTAPHLRATLLAIIRCLLDYGDAQFTAETDESLALARQFYLQAQTLGGHPCLTPIRPDPTYEPALAIPVLTTLATTTATQLRKLRQGFNIAGTPVTVVSDDGQPLYQATPYSYRVLLGRAQQLATQAGQIEAQYESALANLDTQSLALTNARGALAVANDQVAMHAHQVKVASDGAMLAAHQLTKANNSVDTLGAAIAAPPNIYENNLLTNFKTIRDLQNGIAGVDAAIGVAQVAAQNADIGKLIASGGVALVAAGVEVGGYVAKAGLQMILNNAQAGMQANQLMASIENRRQEWAIQLASAQQDVNVANDQVMVAAAQVFVANDDLTTARQQATAATDTLNALLAANLSAAMYTWLVQTLGGVYRFFLQQATATSRLAQRQLAFERAQPVPSFIRADYTQPPATLAGTTPTNTFGLTGAEQLIQDLAAMDGYAFSTDQRKLNVSQTFSLGALFPMEFGGFRDSGELAVALPMAYFDREFPGDYLRLVHQVRLSIVALVPPNRGVRARLTNNGLSRVVAPAALGFSDVILRRDPQSIEVTSPVSATGVFDVDQQSQMLLPFEGSGVDTTWQISLPKAANPFDFATISDVLLTVDYTALHDTDYQALMVRSLNADRTRGGDCLLSLASDFPDQWYQLTNPADPSVGRQVSLDVPLSVFPINLQNYTTTAITVALSSPSSANLGAGVVTLAHGGASADAGTDASGFAGTRRGAASWVSLMDAPPLGTWQLTLDPALGTQLDTGAIDDVVLDITWAAQAPEWPT